jgi:asparagine synthase (glutamine-hydrolysing)
MGALYVIIYNSKNINIDFVNCFMKMKHRGINDSSFSTESSINITNLNQSDYNKVKYYLSRSQISNYLQYTFVYGYHRMAITDITDDATQPFIDPIQNVILIDENDKSNKDRYKGLKNRPIRKLLCNGEIYNYLSLVDDNNFSFKDLSSSCDIEIILPLYIKHSEHLNSAEEGLVATINELDGDFAFVITENISTYVISNINAFAVRDFIGIKPLYYIYNTDNSFWMFVSEIKSIPYFVINNLHYNIIQVPPGTYWSFQNMISGGDMFTKYYDINDYSKLSSCVVNEITPDSLYIIYNKIETILTSSVIKRYNHTLKEIGFLVSGGFDSSILVSIITKYILSSDYSNVTIHLFSIGDKLGGDLDIDYANIFLDFLEKNYSAHPNIKFEHHTIYINDIKIIESDIKNIIYHLETYDTKTINESIPFYYLFKYIKEKTNVKILISGDGLDELCGYQEYEDYNDENYQEITTKVLSNLHLYDILRTDKISQAFNLELRHPYLDKEFVNYVLSIHPKLKRSTIYKNTEEPIEKYIIRKSFDSAIQEELNKFIYLPNEILWRRSSCICNSLTNFELRLTNYFNNLISDIEYVNKKHTLMEIPGINIQTLPSNKLELYYRLIFEELYPNRDYLLPIFWKQQFN